MSAELSNIDLWCGEVWCLPIMDGDRDGQLASHSCHPLSQSSAKKRRKEGDDQAKSNSGRAQASAAPNHQLLLTRVTIEAGQIGEAGETSGHEVELLTDPPTIGETKRPSQPDQLGQKIFWVKAGSLFVMQFTCP